MNREEAIRKIKKMMAIASDPSASDQEIQLAAYRANKLRIQYKLEDRDLFNKTVKEDVVEIKLKQKGCGYIHWVLNSLVKYYQCETAFKGKINKNNTEFSIIGLSDDVEICLPVAEGLCYYLNSMLKDLKDCYVGDTDWRIFKRDYLSGFADGLSNSLQGSIQCIDPKYELAVIGVPEVVKNWVDNKIRVTESHFVNANDASAWYLGQKHGSEYDISRKDLIEA